MQTRVTRSLPSDGCKTNCSLARLHPFLPCSLVHSSPPLLDSCVTLASFSRLVVVFSLPQSTRSCFPILPFFFFYQPRFEFPGSENLLGEENDKATLIVIKRAVGQRGSMTRPIAMATRQFSLCVVSGWVRNDSEGIRGDGAKG